MASNQNKTQLAVIGAGPGGYAAAFRAADLGIQTTIIDPEARPGGVCLHRGCIPSKALLHVAGILSAAREAGPMGLNFAEPTIDLARIRDWKNEVVGGLTQGLAGLCKARGVSYIQGRASLTGPNSLEIEGGDGLQFDHAIIASGSRPLLPAALATSSPLVMTSTEALGLNDLPARLLVVGGGYIGLELATVYAALGSRVTVIEMTSGILPGVDRDLSRVLAKRLDSTLEEVRLDTSVSGLAVDGEKVTAGIQGPEGESEESFDRVLVATGRCPNSQGLGLETTAVETDEQGFIQTNGQLRTAEPSIFAIGDVAGPPLLAHKATHEGLVAAEAIGGDSRTFEPSAIPAVVFTDPEIAWCGVTEAGARAEGLEVAVARFPWQASGRAATLGRGTGLTKLVCEADGGAVLGVGIVGAGAGELIAEGVLAVEMGAVAADLAMTVHPHPTMSETLMEAAEVFAGTCTSIYRPPRR
ncbi:MAG: dihydrolipoyl dehydrogenase [Deltaproteobacteria bacterium]